MPNIQIKKGLAAALSATNPVVASGEPIFETDTLKLKIGDGVTAYNSLGIVGTGSFLLLSGGTLTGSISAPSGNFTNSLQVNGVNVSVSGHSHVIGDVTGLQTALDGKQVSGSYAASSHTHTSSDITNFNSSVSGLLPVTNIIAGTNITVTPSSGSFTINSTASAVFTSLQMGSCSVSAPSIGSNNDLSTGFYFPTSGSLAIASSGYDRFKIDNSGNALFGGQNVDTLRYVDIGNINNSSNAGSILRLVTTNVSGTNNISADLIKYKNGQFSINNNETDVSAFTSFNVGSSERLRITSSGNVGVGTTSPTSKLHVVGNSNLAGTLTFNDFTESVVVIGNSATAKTIALTNGTVQTCTLTGNCTFTMPTATAGKSFTLFLSSGAGSFTATFTSVKWSGGTAPVITTTASKVDILSFISDGTYWYGAFSQNY